MRTSGILMPVFSLRSKGGIGTLGKKAYEFVDFLEKSGQSWWQILPLNPTNYGDSPYQSFSSYAGNPYFIDPYMLIEDGLITVDEFNSFDFGEDDEGIDYGKLYDNRIKMLICAFKRFKEDAYYHTFCSNNAYWLDEYALFMALKNAHGDAAWETWEDEIRLRKPEALSAVNSAYADTISLYKFIQFKFFEQWFALKEYANEKGIGIIGDIPIYVAYDSADVWSDPEQFQLDESLLPKAVAGCPPDAFSEDGQLWGNPLYDWSYMKKDSFSWWKRRLGHALKLYDMIRIDHFRGFESYWAIPFGAETAKEGKWVKGPNMALFNEFKKEFGSDLPIIAEDLGFLTPQVHIMLKRAGFPGMKVLQFAFSAGEDSDYLPHNYNKNCVVYTGTHDNDTILGWAQSANEEDVAMAKEYLRCNENESLNWSMMKAVMMSVGNICILTMQDLIGLGSEGRINTPSTVGDNWQWRIGKGCVNDWPAQIIKDYTKLYYRLPKEK